MKKRNFYIVRHYINGNIKFAVEISCKQSKLYTDYFEFVYDNEAGGLTHWYRIDIQSK